MNRAEEIKQLHQSTPIILKVLRRARKPLSFPEIIERSPIGERPTRRAIQYLLEMSAEFSLDKNMKVVRNNLND
jgi:hypothetical protein